MSSYPNAHGIRCSIKPQRVIAPDCVASAMRFARSGMKLVRQRHLAYAFNPRSSLFCGSGGWVSRYWHLGFMKNAARVENHSMFMVIIFCAAARRGSFSGILPLCRLYGTSALWPVSTQRPKCRSTGRTRPADLLLNHWKGGGPCALDIAFVHPLAHPSHSQQSKLGVRPSKAWSVSNAPNMPKVVKRAMSLLCLCLALMVRYFAINWPPLCVAAQRRKTPRQTDASSCRSALKREVVRMLLQGVHGHIVGERYR